MLTRTAAMLAPRHGVGLHLPPAQVANMPDMRSADAEGLTMPIRPENRDRYPANWPKISARVREIAGQKCEWCGLANGRMIRRGTAPDGRRLYRYADQSAYEDGYDANDGRMVPDTGEDTCDWGRTVRVVLTVAHLDHMPENCARGNLVALCQRCHNRYDAPIRRAGIAERIRAEMAVGDLFDLKD